MPTRLKRITVNLFDEVAAELAAEARRRNARVATVACERIALGGVRSELRAALLRCRAEARRGNSENVVAIVDDALGEA